MIDPTATPGALPTAIETYRAGWALMLARARELLLIGVVWAFISLPGATLGEGMIEVAYSVLVLGPVNFGGSYAFLRAARGEPLQLSDLFLPFRVNYVQAVLGSLLVSMVVMLGFFLFIVPGVVALVRLSWVPYLIVEGRRQALDAVQESWARTGPHAWTILAIEMLAIPVILVGIFFFVVGVIPALILAHLAMAAFYAATVPRAEVVPEAPAPLG